MSTKVGTVVIDIKADTAKLVSGMNKAERAIKSSVTKIKVGVAGLAVAYLGVETAIKVMSTAMDQAQQIVDVAATFEQFNATLQTLEGSSQKAEQSMNWIKDFASVTPFNIDKVTASFISLKAYGLDPTDGLLRTLGDTSAAMGKDIQEAVEAMADAVVGENERLKAFGIRASVTGNKIKYSWTNASGEMRQKIILNNSAIIQSTLSAIFNSKYAGAMQMQSKTWKGLISNLQDNWMIFQSNIMKGGLFDYLKAIVTVVGEKLSKALGTTLESSAIFSKYIIKSIKGIISSLGYTYDALETFGDYFTVIGLTAELAFEGIMVAAIGLGSGIVNIFENIIDGINQGFEGLVNGVISAINGVLDIAATLGVGSGGNIGSISLGNINVGGDFLKSYSDASKKVFLQTSKDLGLAWDELMNAKSGQTFVDDMLKKIDTVYGKLKNTPEIKVEKTDFGDTVVTPTTPTPDNIKKLKDFNTMADNTNKVTNDLSNNTNKVDDTFSNLNNTLSSKTKQNDTYTIVTNVNNSFNKLNNTAKQTLPAINNVTEALTTFIFKFSDTFINSIKNNISSLSSISKNSSFNKLSYKDSLVNIATKRDALIANPLDVNIGSNYKDAYGLFVDSANSYLSDLTNFSSKQDYNFAQASVGSQANIFQETASQTVDVLESMNKFLETINQAFADGILSDEEKATIAGVATDVNNKNQVLLGSASILVGGIHDIPTSLTGTNSVSSSIKKLMGTGNSGISLSSISSSLPSLSVSTGLDLSALSSINANTYGTEVAANATNVSANNTKNAVNTMAGGETLKNLIIKSVSTSLQYIPTEATTYYGVKNGVWGYYSNAGTASSTLNGGSISRTNYEYYKDGGYTGNIGVNQEAGVVHGQEYVVNAPTTKDLGLNGSGGVFREQIAISRQIAQNSTTLNRLIVEQANEIRTMRKEIEDLREEMTA
ncbi:MAG: tape measure protein [Sulfurimonas sp.]